MRKWTGLFAFLLATQAFAAAPFLPEIEDRFQALEEAVSISDQSASGLYAKKVAKVIYDSTSGDNGSSTVDSGTHGMGVTLPAASLVTRSYLYVVNQLTSSGSTGSSTLSFKCEDANNLKTATDMTASSAGAFIEGESTGTAASMKTGIAAACEISAVVGGHDITAGKVILFVEYVQGQ